MERKLASIKRIDSIEPIEGADAIELVKIGGWQCVSKRGEFRVGDPCVYFEIDSHLPIHPRYEFLRKGCFKVLENRREGFRIRTIRLRGQLSQGLALPISSFTEFDLKTLHNAIYRNDELDVTELLNVVKYERPLPGQLSGEARGNFPQFIIKTDAERIQNLKKYFDKYSDIEFEATLKMDGSSMTTYNWNELQSVCSRNIDLKETEGNKFWQIARKYSLPDLLPPGFAIQGELMGPGIQGNKEKLIETDLFLFDVYDISKREYLLPKDRIFFINHLAADVLQKTGLTLKSVPIIAENIKLKDFTMESLLKYAEGKSYNCDIREGLVFRSREKVDGEMLKFKAISNVFLLGEKE